MATMAEHAAVMVANADYLTMFVDVQKEFLFYVVVAWETVATVVDPVH